MKLLDSKFLSRLSKQLDKDAYDKRFKKEFNIDLSEVGDSIPGGKSEGKSIYDFDLEQLVKGTKVELEHTDDPYVAVEITMDHLTEFEDYYDRLKKVEK